MIKAILEEIMTPIVGEGKVYPIFGMGDFPFLTYTITPIDGGVVKESQIEVKVISDRYSQAIELREVIEKKLDMIDKTPSLLINDVVIRSGLAGGGTVFNDAIQVWELSLIFIIKWRVRK